VSDDRVRRVFAGATAPRVATAVGIAIALLAGAAVLRTARFHMDADGMSYLDYSDRFLDGSWRSAPNGYWSPGYPILLAIIRSIIGSGGSSDIPALRIATATGYLASLLAFALLLVALRRSWGALGPGAGRAPGNAPGNAPGATLSEAFAARIWLPVLGWPLFVWTSIGVTGLAHTTPDIWVSAATYAAVAAAVLTARSRPGWRWAITLGVVLGLGYLFKAVMFPLALVILATTLVERRRRSGSILPVLLSSGLFAVLAAPQVILISRLAGHPTFSEVGTLVHEWYVDGVPCPLFGEPVKGKRWDSCMVPRPGSPDGIAPQPFPRLSQNPSVYVFPHPAAATFPAWYDATRWYPRLRPAFHLHPQLVTFVKNLGDQWGMLTPFAIAAFALVLALGRWPAGLRRAEPLLLVPALATFAMYALSFSSNRYLGASTGLLVLGIAPLYFPDDTRTPVGRSSWPWLAPAMAAAAFVLLLRALGPALDQAWYLRGRLTDSTGQAARELRAAGLLPGSRVGIIGDGSNAYWARIARLHVIAELHSAERFRYWLNTPTMQDSVTRAFRRAGAVAIVAAPPPAGALLPAGWSRLNTRVPLAVYPLR